MFSFTFAFAFVITTFVTTLKFVKTGTIDAGPEDARARTRRRAPRSGAARLRDQNENGGRHGAAGSKGYRPSTDEGERQDRIRSAGPKGGLRFQSRRHGRAAGGLRGLSPAGHRRLPSETHQAQNNMSHERSQGPDEEDRGGIAQSPRTGGIEYRRAAAARCTRQSGGGGGVAGAFPQGESGLAWLAGGDCGHTGRGSDIGVWICSLPKFQIFDGHRKASGEQ